MKESQKLYSETEVSEMANLLEQTTTELEQKNKEILNLSSQISMLKSEMLKLAEKNEKLNNADLIIKENERLKRQSEKDRKEKEQAERELKTGISNCREREKKTFRKEARLDEHISKEADRKIADLREEIKKDNEKCQNELKNDLNADYEVYRGELEAEYTRKNLSFSKIFKICLILILLLTVGLTFTHCQNKLRQENHDLKVSMSKIKTNTYRPKEKIQLYGTDKKQVNDFFGRSIISSWDNFFVVKEKSKEWTKIHFEEKDYFIKTKDLHKAERVVVDFQ